MKYIIPLVILILIAGGAFFATQNPSKNQSPKVVESPKEEVKVLTTSLHAVGVYKGGGVATKSFDGKKFVHSVTANLSDPSKGKFYEGWLVKKTPTLLFFSTGKLNKENSQYKLNFETNQDYPDYNFVVVTEETEALGLDGKPEAHVLEGSF